MIFRRTANACEFVQQTVGLVNQALPLGVGLAAGTDTAQRRRLRFEVGNLSQAVMDLGEALNDLGFADGV